MASLGKRKLTDAAPPLSHTCIDFGRQPIADMRPIKPDNMRKVVGNSCPVCHGAIVELSGHLPWYQGRRDLATIRHVDGSVCALPWNDLGPVGDTTSTADRIKLAQFNAEKAFQESLAKMSPVDREYWANW